MAKKWEKSRRDAACTACRGTRQLQFPQQAGVEAVMAGLGGEEVGLGKEFVSAGAFFLRDAAPANQTRFLVAFLVRQRVFSREMTVIR